MWCCQVMTSSEMWMCVPSLQKYILDCVNWSGLWLVTASSPYSIGILWRCVSFSNILTKQCEITRVWVEVGSFNQSMDQIIFGLQMAAIKKEKEKEGEREKEERRKGLVGVQRQQEIWTICASPYFLVVKKHFCIFLFLITGQCALWLFSGTDFRVYWQTNSEAISQW